MGPDGKVAPRSTKEAGGLSEESINTHSLTELSLSSSVVLASQAAWKAFLGLQQSREAAGEAIYSAFFDSLPGMRSFFTTSKAVQAMKFLVWIQNLVMAMGDAANLQIMAETLGFQHLHLEVTAPRVSTLTRAIIDAIAFELGAEFTSEAQEGLRALLCYVGGVFIYVRTHYNDRIKLLRESWKTANDNDKAINDKSSQLQRKDTTGESDEEEEGEDSPKFANGNGHAHGNGHVNGNGYGHSNGNGKAQESTWSRVTARFSSQRQASKLSEASQDSGHTEGSGSSGDHTMEGVTNTALPTSFIEMFQINAAVMGFGKNSMTWSTDVLEALDTLVKHVSNGARVGEESDVLVLRLAKYPPGTINLPQFKACMLAALRSLLPKQWSTKHEEAWTWLWDHVARMLERNMGKPPGHEKAVEAFWMSMDAAQQYEMRKQIYAKFFELAPSGQDYFKQSNTRLHFVAERILAMTLEMYKTPRRLVSEISALGLRHVGFGIPTDLIPFFVTSLIEVLRTLTSDDTTVEAVRWSIGLISKILVRTILEGSTVVMKSINANSTKQLKKAIECAPRGVRAEWLLDVQVGDQHISPLSWAIESGSLEVAGAIIKDLLTIRADREHYYYGFDELFTRHNDIVKRLCEEAPTLLPTLLDGLVWRSHRSKDGMRRVNSYVKHMLVNSDGGFSDSLKWISDSGEPALVSHPIIALMADTLWSGIVFRHFIYSRMWNICSLCVLILSQEVLPGIIETEDSEAIRIMIFTGRLFNYVIGMGRLALFHISRIWLWCKMTMKRIIEEIDTDGNGSIDYEEMVEALHKFKDTVKDEIKKAIQKLKDGEGPADESRKTMGSQEKNLYNVISFTLMICLAVMCTHEPMFWCAGSTDWPTSQCADLPDGLLYRYSVFSMIAMVVHWLILIDLAVFSTEISAFLLVVNHVLGEVKQFLFALGFLLLLFGSSIAISCRGCPTDGGDFTDMPNAMVSLFAITVGLYQGDYRDIQEDVVLLGAIFFFVTFSVVLLLNLLIAQLNRSYEYIYKDMLGFARLNRASLIVDSLQSVQKARWRKFVESMRFDERLEFDEGDLGVAGGVQTLEPASLHRQSVESIQRFGGLTSADLPWLATKVEAEHEDQDDRLERIENMIHQALRQMDSLSGKTSGSSDPMVRQVSSSTRSDSEGSET